MSDFPKLSTGAALQLPAERSWHYSTRVLRFLDGTEQRFRERSRPVRRWRVRLDMLGDEEMAALEAFFVTQQGALHDFSFTDPWDNVEYPSCSLETDDSFWHFRTESWSQTELVIKENRS